MQDGTTMQRAELKVEVQQVDALLATFLGELPSADMPAVLATLGEFAVAFDAALARAKAPATR